MSEAVFIDTGFFKALVNGKDDFHKKSVEIWGKFSKSKIVLTTSNYIVDESLTVIRIKCGLAKALKFRDLLGRNSDMLKIMRISVKDEAKAWFWFEKDWSKLSYTDCISFAIMKRLGIKRVASFDNHFKRAGFKIEK